MSEKRPQAASLHTAEELHHELVTALREGEWQKAANVHATWLRDFGDRADMLQAIASFRGPVALGLLQIDRLDEATPLIEALLGAPGGATQELRQELCFQRAACALRLNLTSKALEYFQDYTGLFSRAVLQNGAQAAGLQKKRIQDAHLLISQCLLREGRPADAAAQIDQIRLHFDAPHATQANALQFRALVEAEQNDPALRFFKENEPELQANLQLLEVHSCLLKLGARLLESARPRDAIACLQRVKRVPTLTAYQKKRLATIDAQTPAAPPAAGSNAPSRSALAEAGDIVRYDLEAFGRQDGMDAAVRLQTATAYAAMDRPLEAALILDEARRLWVSDPALSNVGATLAMYWSQAERWNEAVEAADAHHRQRPQSPESPGLGLLKGTALQKLGRMDEAISAFRAVSARFPKTEPALRARLLEAFALMIQGNAPDAARIFEVILSARPPGNISEEASFGLCLAHALQSEHAECRSAAAGYERKHSEGEHLPDVLYQKARAAHLSRDYKTAILELRAFMDAFPNHEKRGEAGVLLGDALVSENAPTEALTAYTETPASFSAYDQAWFKAAPLFLRLNRAEELLGHLLLFQTGRPKSNRLAEAVQWTIRALPPSATENETDKPAWELVALHGNRWDVPAVDTLLKDLCSRRAQHPELAAALEQTLKAAETAGQTTLQVRMLWAKAGIEAAGSEEANRLLMQAVSLAKPQSTSPAILADFAAALLAQGNADQACAHWKSLLKWHPRALEKDRALAALAGIAQANGELEKALEWVERFKLETESSPLLGAMLLKKAEVFTRTGREDEAKRTLESLLQKSGVSGEWKARALVMLADHHMQSGNPRLAIPYYQRVYVMYGRWTEPLARAYLRSGMAFEQLENREAARRTYREMLDREIPDRPEEILEATKRLHALGEGTP